MGIAAPPPPRLRRAPSQPRVVRLSGILGTPSTLLGRQHAVRVNFTLELAGERLPSLRCTSRAILGLRPRHVSRDPGLKHSIVVGAHAAPPDSTGCTNVTTSARLTY